jgi:hypothetical protein
VKKRLFLDGVQVDGDYLAVGMREKFSIDVLPHLAYPELPIGDFTTMVAEEALNQQVVFFVVKHRLFGHEDPPIGFLITKSTQVGAFAFIGFSGTPGKLGPAFSFAHFKLLMNMCLTA